MTRILLSKAASDALSETGERAFAIVHRCMRGVEEPETAGRWCITVAPIEWKTAQAASRVLLGEMKAIQIKKPKAAPDACLASMSAKPLQADAKSITSPTNETPA